MFRNIFYTVDFLVQTKKPTCEPISILSIIPPSDLYKKGWGALDRYPETSTQIQYSLVATLGNYPSVAPCKLEYTNKEIYSKLNMHVPEPV